MSDQQVVALSLTGILIGLGLGYGAAMRWAGNHLRRALREQADRICAEYAKDRELMAACLRAAGVLPWEDAKDHTSIIDLPLR